MIRPYMTLVTRDGMAHRAWPVAPYRTLCGREAIWFVDHDGRHECSQCRRRLLGWLRDFHPDVIGASS